MKENSKIIVRFLLSQKIIITNLDICQKKNLVRFFYHTQILKDKIFDVL